MKRAELIQSEKLDVRTALLRFTGDTATRQAFIEASGEALRARYSACEASFRQILVVTGAEKAGKDIVSPAIVIGRGIKTMQGHNYSGTWEAYVLESDYQRTLMINSPKPVFKTVALFKPDDKQRQGLSVFSQPDARESFGAPYAFSYVDEVGWTEKSLREALRDYEKPTETAEETLQMLWTALADPSLNPEFTTTAELLQPA